MKLKQILRNDKLKKNPLQKLLFLIPIVIVVLVFIFYREAGAYRAQNELYTYIGEVKTTYAAGTKFQHTDEGTFLKNAKGQSISSRPLYNGSDDKIILPVPYAWITMAPGGASMCRLESFSTVEASNSSIQLKDENQSRDGVSGFLFDGEGTYIFLEPVTLDWEAESCEAPSMSFVTVQYGGSMNLHIYGKDSASLIPIDGKEVKASFQNGGSISLGTNKLWLPNGTWMLLFTEPELLPRMDEMK